MVGSGCAGRAENVSQNMRRWHFEKTLRWLGERSEASGHYRVKEHATGTG